MLSDQFPSVDPGRFIHRITFLNQQTVQDISGSGIVWAPGSPPEVAWVSMNAVRGTDVIKAGQDVAQVYMTITTYFRSGVLPNQRVLGPNGSTWVIRAIENVEQRNVYMILTCIGLGLNE